MTPEQRQQAKQQKRAELETWAQQNGLSAQTHKELVGHGVKGFGKRGHGWRDGSSTGTPSPSVTQ